jgi:hypothetical protein
VGRHYYSWFDQICHLVACDINIVDHDVQFAKPRCCLVHGATHLLLDRDVVVDEHDVLAVASEGIAQLLAGDVLDVRVADLGTVLLEEVYDGFTNAIDAASDQGALPLQHVIQKDFFFIETDVD